MIDAKPTNGRRLQETLIDAFDQTTTLAELDFVAREWRRASADLTPEENDAVQKAAQRAAHAILQENDEPKTNDGEW